jgi:hypothetical protein
MQSSILRGIPPVVYTPRGIGYQHAANRIDSFCSLRFTLPLEWQRAFRRPSLLNPAAPPCRQPSGISPPRLLRGNLSRQFALMVSYPQPPSRRNIELPVVGAATIRFILAKLSSRLQPRVVVVTPGKRCRLARLCFIQANLIATPVVGCALDLRAFHPKNPTACRQRRGTQ